MSKQVRVGIVGMGIGLPEPVSVTGVAGAHFGPRGLGYWDYKPPARKISRQFAADDYGGGFIRFEGGVGLQNHDEHQVCYFRRVSVSSL